MEDFISHLSDRLTSSSVSKTASKPPTGMYVYIGMHACRYILAVTKEQPSTVHSDLYVHISQCH